MSNASVLKLQEKLCQLAAERGWAVKESPLNLTATSYRSVELANGLGLGSIENSTGANATTNIMGISIGACSVLIGSLNDDLAQWEDSLQLAHQQAAIARSWLLGGTDVDLYLFLVGPIGSANSEPWHDIARTIERDERICRKLVWLPALKKDENSEQESGLEDFCERTFLAEPWASSDPQTQHDLDPLGALERELGARFERETSLPATVLKKWLRILDRQTDGQKIAQALIATLQDE